MLTGGRKCVIFQLIDDHSRYAVASHVAWGETSEAAIAVFDKAVAAHGVPQRLLSDNGVALNPSRRGYLGQLVAHVSSLGVEAITGKPDKPTTQGKNERFHQTLFRYLDKQPLADTLAELQAQVDAFDHVYNTERPHQGLPGRVTPLTAWQATEKAEAPRPRQPATDAVVPGEESAPPAPCPTWRDTPGEHLLKVRGDGTVVIAHHPSRTAGPGGGEPPRSARAYRPRRRGIAVQPAAKLLLEHPIPGADDVGDEHHQDVHATPNRHRCPSNRSATMS